MTLLILRTAPSHDGSPAPATRLMGGTFRMLVPKLETTNFENKPKRHDSKYIYTGQTLKPLKEGDNVRIRDTLKNNWMRKAKVIEQHKSPRSYIVKTEDGNHLQHNHSHLLLTRKPSSNSSLDNKMNDCDHNESDRTEISQENIGNNSYVTRYGRVIKKPVRFGDT